jgi:3-deoxy-D-manno-octulosonic-acid transferase
VVVSGDPRHNRIVERVANIRPAQAVRPWAGGAPVLVAGSLEPGDDAPVARALARLAMDLPDLHSVLVPHDPSVERLDALRRTLGAHGLEAIRWSGPEQGVIPPGRCVLTTVHGLLADLYLAADIAYVGGGFRKGRLHAVAEPAALGVPVIVGPRWRGAADVEPMVASGGATPFVDARGQALADVVRRLATDPEERSRRGLAARSVLTECAARTTAEAVLRLVKV